MMKVLCQFISFLHVPRDTNAEQVESYTSEDFSFLDVLFFSPFFLFVDCNAARHSSGRRRSAAAALAQLYSLSTPFSKLVPARSALHYGDEC